MAPAVPEDWLPRCGPATSCSVHPRISPSPRECARQLWPALQGVILGYGLFNYNPHHCTVTWSEGCDSPWTDFLHLLFSFLFFFSSTEFPQFPKCPWETECLLHQLGTEEQPDASRDGGQFVPLSCLGLYLMAPSPCQSQCHCWRLAPCKSHPLQQAGPRHRGVYREGSVLRSR